MAATFPVQTQPRRIGDLVIFELHPGYDRVSATVKNGSGSAVDILDPVGYPLKSDGSGGYALAFAGDEASVIGLLLWMHEVNPAAGVYTPQPLPILTRGPVLIDATMGIPVNDAAGSAFNVATIISTLKALSPPIIAINEPAIVQTQTL